MVDVVVVVVWLLVQEELSNQESALSSESLNRSSMYYRLTKRRQFPKYLLAVV